MDESRKENKRKPKLTVEEQIEHLKSRGVTFKLCSENKAAHILAEQDHYFRLAAYRVLFPKRVGGAHDGEYARLDFGHLVDLTEIDQELRGFLLPLTLNVESAAKTKLIKRITENPSEDGYTVFADYLTYLNHAERNRRKGEISHLRNDAYLGPLVARYPIEEMPAADLPEPEYESQDDYYLKLTLRNDLENRIPRMSAGDVGNHVGNVGNVGNQLSETEERVLALVKNDPKTSARKISDKLEISVRQAERTLASLREKGVIVREGGTRGCWKVR